MGQNTAEDDEDDVDTPAWFYPRDDPFLTQLRVLDDALRDLRDPRTAHELGHYRRLWTLRVHVAVEHLRHWWALPAIIPLDGAPPES